MIILVIEVIQGQFSPIKGMFRDKGDKKLEIKDRSWSTEVV